MNPSNQPDSFPAQQPPPNNLSSAEKDSAPAYRLSAPLPHHKPLMCYIILAINIAIFLVDNMLLNQRLLHWGAKDNYAILHGEFWRLITPIFFHLNVPHLGFNSFFLYRVGPQVEHTFGSFRFAVIYVLSGISGVVASLLLSVSPSIGASAALFGLIGVLIPMYYHNRAILADTRQIINSLLQTIGINLVIGLMPGIDNWGHIGGLIGGLVLGWFVSPRYVARISAPGMFRIDDASSPVTTWVTSALFGAALSLIVIADILIQRLR